MIGSRGYSPCWFCEIVRCYANTGKTGMYCPLHTVKLSIPEKEELNHVRLRLILSLSDDWITINRTGPCWLRPKWTSDANSRVSSNNGLQIPKLFKSHSDLSINRRQQNITLHEITTLPAPFLYTIGHFSSFVRRYREKLLGATSQISYQPSRVREDSRPLWGCVSRFTVVNL